MWRPWAHSKQRHLAGEGCLCLHAVFSSRSPAHREPFSVHSLPVLLIVGRAHRARVDAFGTYLGTPRRGGAPSPLRVPWPGGSLGTSSVPWRGGLLGTPRQGRARLDASTRRALSAMVNDQWSKAQGYCHREPRGPHRCAPTGEWSMAMVQSTSIWSLAAPESLSTVPLWRDRGEGGEVLIVVSGRHFQPLWSTVMANHNGQIAMVGGRDGRGGGGQALRGVPRRDRNGQPDQGVDLLVRQGRAGGHPPQDRGHDSGTPILHTRNPFFRPPPSLRAPLHTLDVARCMP